MISDTWNLYKQKFYNLFNNFVHRFICNRPKYSFHVTSFITIEIFKFLSIDPKIFLPYLFSSLFQRVRLLLALVASTAVFCANDLFTILMSMIIDLITIIKLTSLNWCQQFCSHFAYAHIFCSMKWSDMSSHVSKKGPKLKYSPRLDKLRWLKVVPSAYLYAEKNLS